ncbi:zinc finger BED domain-containing protein 4-like [Nothobranchius furzeri]|uniref:zinc finger BED domain-containing protein 4-like n=1 Tax=Nothobranchius furzeri TaxID=105023 RepID=UPI003904C9D9
MCPLYFIFVDDSPRAATLTRYLGEMIVKDLQHMSIVEDQGFQQFVRALDPKYKLPGRKKLTETVLVNMFTECKEKVRASLKNASSVVLTSDMWTSVSTEAYLTVTCHLIENWQMREFVLETHTFHGTHTADNIRLELKRITEECGITEKVVAVVTDNGANMVAAVHKAGWRHHPCFAHTLNLIVKDSLKAVPEVVQVLEKCSAIVSYFHHSSKATEKLRDIQQQLKVAEHKLIQSVETRWNSISVSKVIPLVSLIHRAVSACEHQSNSLATQLAQQCQRRFRGVETIHCLAASTFVDVRLKHFGFRDKDNVEVMKKRLCAEMQEVYQAGQSAVPPTPCSVSTACSTSEPSASVPSTSGYNQSPTASGSTATKGGIWTDFDKQVMSNQHHRSASTDVLIEVRRYSEEKLIRRDKDPLLWWQEHGQTFPALSKLAVRYLGIVASSVPAERIFSKAGEVLRKKRSRLKGKTVNMLLFLNKNL